MTYRLLHRIDYIEEHPGRVLIFTLETPTGAADFAPIPLHNWQSDADVENAILVAARNYNIVMKGITSK